MELTLEQRLDVNFWVKLQKYQREMLEKLKTVYGESTGQKKSRMSKSKIKIMLTCFLRYQCYHPL
jgi:hypothetical protein